VAIPVFQFGTFSDVDLTVFAGAVFSFGGRIHTNGNFFLTAQDGGTTTMTDKVTAVGDFIRQRMQNGLAIAPAGFNGTIRAATAPNTFRSLLINEGSLTDGVGSPPNANWSNISLTTYNGYIRDGGCPPPGPPAQPCPVPDRGTGAKKLQLALVTPGVGGSNPDLVRRPPPGEDINKPVLFGERLYGKVSLRILLSDTPADILNLPTVTGTAPVRLGDDAGAGLTLDWSAAGNAPAGYGPVDATHPPIARSPGVQTVQTAWATPTPGPAPGAATSINVVIPGGGLAGAFHSPGDLGNNGNALIGTIEILNNNAPFPPTHNVYIDCQSITATQFKSCRNHTAANALPVVPNNSFISITEGGVNYVVRTAGAGVVAAGVTVDYNVTSAGGTAAFASNTFWMRSTADNTWSVVTCTGVTSNTNQGGPNPPGSNPRPADYAHCPASRCLTWSFIYKPAKGVKRGPFSAKLTWTAPVEDFDLYILDAKYGDVGHCGASAGSAEYVSVDTPVPGHKYLVVVDEYRSIPDTVHVTVSFPGAPFKAQTPVAPNTVVIFPFACGVPS